MAALLLLAAIRFALALAGVLLAISRGVDANVALVTLVFGALLCGFAVMSTKQGRPTPRSVEPHEPAWRLALRWTYPSTIGLASLTVFGLVFEPQLAALTAGLLAALGALALASAAQLEWWRRSLAGNEEAELEQPAHELDAGGMQRGGVE